MTGNGVSPLTRTTRDLAAAARLLVPVLQEMGKYGSPVPVTAIAEKLRLPLEDACRALVALEHAGLVQTTHFRITAEGIRAAKEG